MEKIKVKDIDVSIVKETDQETALIVRSAEVLVIKDQTTYESAGEFRSKIREGIKNLETLRKTITGPLDQAKSAVMNLFRPSIDMRTAVMGKVDKLLTTYDTEQEKKRQEEESRLAREAEKKRQEALKKAEEARAAGKEEKAEKYEEKAAAVISPVLAPTTTKPNGIQYRDHWTVEVIDFKLLPDTYKLPNMPMINKYVNAVKGMVPLSGVKFIKERIVASRTT